MKKVGNIFAALTLAFGLVTTFFWLWLCIGSWQDKINPNVAGKGQGCGEFDLNMPIGGHLYSPSDEVISKFSGGYFVLNRGSFKFTFQRQGTDNEAGTAVIWINPLNATAKMYYKTQSVRGVLVDGHR